MGIFEEARKLALNYGIENNGEFRLGVNELEILCSQICLNSSHELTKISIFYGKELVFSSTCSDDNKTGEYRLYGRLKWNEFFDQMWFEFS